MLAAITSLGCSEALGYDLTDGPNPPPNPSRKFFAIKVEQTGSSPARASADWFWLLKTLSTYIMPAIRPIPLLRIPHSLTPPLTFGRNARFPDPCCGLSRAFCFQSRFPSTGEDLWPQPWILVCLTSSPSWEGW